MTKTDLVFMETTTGMAIALIVLVFLGIAIIWNLQRDKTNHVDIKDLVCSDGQLNEAKFMRFTAFVVSTWGFIYLIVDQRFSEWYFAGYMAAWAGNALFNKWLNIRDQSNQQAAAPSPPAPKKPVI